MKQFFLLCALIFIPIIAVAQSSATNDIAITREVGEDGFIWHKVKKGNLYGAYDIEGKEIIPVKYTTIYYSVDKYVGTHFFKVSNGDFQGAYTREGTLVISPDRHYTDVNIWATDNYMICWYVGTSRGLYGLLDAKGNEVIAPTYIARNMSVFGEITETSPFFLTSVYDEKTGRGEHGVAYIHVIQNGRDGRNRKEGILDLNGNVVCPTEYISCSISMTGNRFELSTEKIPGQSVRTKIQYNTNTKYDYLPYENLYYPF